MIIKPYSHQAALMQLNKYTHAVRMHENVVLGCHHDKPEQEKLIRVLFERQEIAMKLMLMYLVEGARQSQPKKPKRKREKNDTNAGKSTASTGS